MNKKILKIAIDGPVGSGKGTLALALAEKLDAWYLYTGGMYRALTLACLRQKIDINDEKKVLEVLEESSIRLQPVKSGTRTFLNNEEVSDEIFLPAVSSVTSIIAAMLGVRREMVARQRKMAEGKNIVIEGRDIATDVAQDAELKIYLTADIKVRTERRLAQLEERGIKTTFDEVRRELEERDKRDTERQASPLTITPDSYVLDTTNLTIEETVKKVMEKLREKGLA